MELKGCYIDTDRLKNDQLEFQCAICLMVVDDPYECPECGTLLGKICLNQWRTKSRQCPKCKKDSYQYRNITGAVQLFYNKLQIQCKYENCKKYVCLIDLESHEKNCQEKQCKLFDICGQVLKEKNQIFCSIDCELLSKIIENKDNHSQSLQDIKYFTNAILGLEQNQENNQIQNDQIIEEDNTCRFSFKNRCSDIQLSEDRLTASINENDFIFKTVISDKYFEQGVHYFEVAPTPETKNEIKVGIVTKIPTKFSQSFADVNTGFAYYGIGQLRNATNKHYGYQYVFIQIFQINFNDINIECFMEKKSKIKVKQDNYHLDCIYFQKRNGQCWGEAFTSDALKAPNQVYLAVSLLHKAGCQIIPDQPIPQSFQELID